MNNDDIYPSMVGQSAAGPKRPKSRFARRRDRLAGVLLVLALVVGVAVQTYPRVIRYWQSHQHDRLLQAIDQGNADDVAVLVRANPWLLNQRDSANQTAMARAVIGRQDQVAEVLRQAGALSVLLVQVRNAATGEPLVGADVRVRADGHTVDYLPGNDGNYLLELADPPRRQLMIRASHPRYAAVSWQTRRGAEQAWPEQNRVVLDLEPARAIGGVVQTPDGEPIAGAGLSFWLMAPVPDTDQPLHYMIRDMVTTNERGEWRSRAWPGRMPVAPQIRVTHSKYVDRLIHASQAPGLDVLYDQQAVLVLEPGINMAGVVINHEQRPVASAGLTYNAENQATATVHSDQQGRFNLLGLAEGPVTVRVQAAGYAPATLQLNVSQDAQQPIQIQLDVGRKIVGRVHDAVGLPVAGAVVRSIGARDDGRLNWQAHTNVLGEFTWNHAPHEDVMLQFSADGYMGMRRTVAAESSDPVSVRLYPYLTIQGHVRDGSTRRDIESYELTVGYQDANGQVRWTSRRRRQLDQPTFQHNLTTWSSAYKLRVTSPGYQAFETDWIEPGLPVQEVAIDMSPAEPVWQGRLLLPDGKPVAGAEVHAFRMPIWHIVLEQDGAIRQLTRETATADAQGQWRLYDPESNRVVIAHPAGFADLLLDEPNDGLDITLQPWSRLEGYAVAQGEPLAEQRLAVDVYPRANRRERIRISTYTDEQGRFVLEHVPMGKVEIHHYHASTTRPFALRTRLLELSPGQTASVQFGGQGLPVVGRVDMEQVRAIGQQYRLHLRPRNHDGDLLNVLLDEQGHFAFDAVTPGRYDLQLFAESSEQGRAITHRSVRKTIRIAEDADQQVDLGLLALPLAEPDDS